MTENEPLTKEILRQISVIQMKIDGIGSALETLARVEERQTADRDTVNRIWTVIDNHGRALATLSETLAEVQRQQGSRSEIHLLWGGSATLLAACGWLLQQVLKS